MIEILVNGSPRELAEGDTIATLVEQLGAPSDGRGIAVALDGEVVPRTAWAATELHDGGRVEVVVAVQGG